MEPEPALQAVSDDELLRRLVELVSRSRRVEADLVAHIGEVDARRLYARFAFPSMFAYCTDGLHLSEAEAYRRITVARAARKHGALIAMLRDGRLHLTAVAMLAPLLTPENRDELLERATHRSKREVEELIAALYPRADAPSLIWKVPEKRQRWRRGRPCAHQARNGSHVRPPSWLRAGRRNSSRKESGNSSRDERRSLAVSRRPCAEPCTNGMAAAVTTWTSRDDAARSGTDWSSTTGSPSEAAAITAPRTCFALSCPQHPDGGSGLRARWPRPQAGRKRGPALVPDNAPELVPGRVGTRVVKFGTGQGLPLGRPE